MDYHVMAGIITGLLAVVAHGIYIRDTLHGKTKPHAFTWVVWGVTLGIAGAVAYTGQAVVSAVTLSLGTGACLFIGALALRYGERNITRSDLIYFLSALAIIPLWAMTDSPLLAASLVTTIDALGYAPTFRKSWAKPQEENAKAFAFHTTTNVFSILAVSPYTLVTGLYPTVTLLINASLVLMLIVRRRIIATRRQFA